MSGLAPNKDDFATQSCLCTQFYRSQLTAGMCTLHDKFAIIRVSVCTTKSAKWWLID